MVVCQCFDFWGNDTGDGLAVPSTFGRLDYFSSNCDAGAHSNDRGQPVGNERGRIIVRCSFANSLPGEDSPRRLAGDLGAVWRFAHPLRCAIVVELGFVDEHCAPPRGRPCFVVKHGGVADRAGVRLFIKPACCSVSLLVLDSNRV